MRLTGCWLRSKLGCYVTTERNGRSIATQRPSLARARSLRSDQAERTLDRYAATELGSSSVATYTRSWDRSERASFRRVQKTQRGKTRWSGKTEVARLQARTRQRVKRGRLAVCDFESLPLCGFLFMTCFESSSARCELCGGAEDVEHKHRGMV
ncbi:hypothetical protein DY000_02039170 [Brassica cretica]|uniref:Uncharacterized protein n=1 Tax=Brassica cretica TaxID=69181 RepID=A0ABQ7B5U5_BRACR|nr:hypothetical protein DY000_02039170 [Brassica cretica]